MRTALQCLRLGGLRRFVGTGIWNIVSVQPDWSNSYGTTLIVKLVVGASGITDALHARARSSAGLAPFGAVSGATALGPLFLGILLTS